MRVDYTLHCNKFFYIIFFSYNFYFRLQYYIKYKYCSAVSSCLYWKGMRYRKKQEIPGEKLQAVLNQFARKALRVVQEQNVAAYWSRLWTATKREG